MIALILDTSSKSLNLAIVKDNVCLIKKTVDTDNGHSVVALDQISVAIAEVNLTSKDIDYIMVTIGPGSFTGIRIGLSISKTFAYVNKIKIIPMSTLKMNVIGENNSEYIISIIDARRDNVYAAIYDADYNEVLTDTFLSKESLKIEIKKLSSDIAIIGDTTIGNYKSKPALFNPEEIMKYYPLSNLVDQFSVNPKYLKLTEAEENLNK